MAERVLLHETGTEELMKIVFLYDSGDPVSRIVHAALSEAASGAVTESVDAGTESLKPCLGCFDCWIRTPGICVHTGDAGASWLKKRQDADFEVVISKIFWGGFSPCIKGYLDRQIPSSHPFFRKVGGEMHHRPRYGRSPALLVVGHGAESAEAEACFMRYTAANRKNAGTASAEGTLVLGPNPDYSHCAAWLARMVKQ
jgi:Multimeric flavodoxin WrbA